MRRLGRFCTWRARGLGIMLMIFSLGRTPLPAPDFHNVRHHDGPGQVCEYHDHLLRWHPNAGSAEDVAILHWHWFLPTPGETDHSPEQSGPAMHAHVVDGFAPTAEDGPQIISIEPFRLIDQAGERISELIALPATDRSWAALGSRAGPGAVRAFCATFAPRKNVPSLLVRWMC